ncbi:MAG TPA: alpha/beta hydrolase [Thermoleophilaceae bacterium]|nr:alpha/beta hydrolase [Thermoleophilaceae bacterium]
MATDSASWRSEALGERKELRLAQGTLPYHEAGSGPAIVFVHGALVNANLWRKVVPELARDFRCVALDLPLGSHLKPMPPEADLSPPALADLIADAIEALDLEDATLVGNDTGGALCQLVATRRPAVIGRLVLTSCDAFDNFPPKVMQPAMPILRLRGALRALYAPVRLAAVRRRLMTLVGAAKRPVEPAAAASYGLPAVRSAEVRRDARKLLAGIDKSQTLEAGRALAGFDRPALIAWSREDKLFPARYAERLAAALPNARLEWVEDSYTFSPEDQPDRLAGLIAEFAREPQPAPAA